MKVYLIFYTTYLGGSEFLGVFATEELAKKWIETYGKNEQSIEYTIERWEVRNDC